jgi:hypothetical protein
MNLTKALKLKKKLIKQAGEAYTRFRASNSHEVGVEPTYSAEKAYTDWTSLTNELIELKAKIHQANVPIAHKIFSLGELKSMVKQLRGVDTDSGKIRKRGYGTDELVEYKAYINTIERDMLITELEGKIETLQEEIESHNALTKI